MATIDGLISGISTADYIKSILTLESGPQALLVSRKSTEDKTITALQSLNVKIASLAEHAKKAAKAASWEQAKVSVTQPGIAVGTEVGATATTTSSAKPGSLTFKVDQVASSQISLLSLPANLGEAPTFAITQGGEDFVVTAHSNSLPDIVDAFNVTGSGVKATLLTVDETDALGMPTGNKVQILQLSSTETGEGQAFTVAVADGGGGSEQLALETLSAASDARITLFPGSGAERALTSGSNTFSGVLTGVDITVRAETAAGAQPLRLDVTRDDAAAKTLASGLVSNLNAILGDIENYSKATPSKTSDGKDSLTPGLFAGNSSTRTLQQRLQSEGSGTVDGLSASEVGIVIGRDGTFTFDSETFDAAMKENPDRTRDVLMGLAAILDETATSYSDKIDGVITQEIATRQDTVKDYTERISMWDERLKNREAALLRQFSAMEAALASLQSQSNALTAVLATMKSSSQSNSSW